MSHSSAATVEETPPASPVARGAHGHDPRVRRPGSVDSRVRKGGFRFAIVLSLGLAAVAGTVAATYHLPLRDPDGVAVPTYVRLPIILLLAFLTDVVPRAAWRGRSLRRFPRHPGRGDPRALALGAHPVRAGRARRVVPHLRGVPQPQELRARSSTGGCGTPASSSSTAIVLLGHDPAAVLHDLFGIGWAAHFFSFVYVAWIVLVPGDAGGRPGVVARPRRRRLVRHGGRGGLGAGRGDVLRGADARPGHTRSRRTSARSRTPTSRRCRSR